MWEHVNTIAVGALENIGFDCADALVVAISCDLTIWSRVHQVP